MSRISRRIFGCIAVGTWIHLPTASIAQVKNVVRRIGWLENGAPNTPELIAHVADLLRQRGWIENQNLHIERRYDNGHPELLPSLAAELVRERVEVIVTRSTPATLAAKAATTTIPIIFSVGDPVRSGLVASLARSGGNLTGYSIISSEIDAKSLSLLKQMLPDLQRVAFLWEREHPFFRLRREAVENACRSAGVQAIFAEYGQPVELKETIQLAARRGAQALIVNNGYFSWDHRFEIFSEANRLSLPTIATDGPMARDPGALLAYSPVASEGVRVLMEYVDRVLRGANPADLPVREPTQFELIINLKTAHALQLTVPKALLLQATDVID
jgi:putative ABC transport system substrate-binding protein